MSKKPSGLRMPEDQHQVVNLRRRLMALAAVAVPLILGPPVSCWLACPRSERLTLFKLMRASLKTKSCRKLEDAWEAVGADLL